MLRTKLKHQKYLAKQDLCNLAYNIDIQAVLTTSKGSAVQIFYLKKLAAYNLIIYNLATRNVICYLWDETQGQRGANEIALCIYDFVMS